MNKLIIIFAIMALLYVAQGQVYNCNNNKWAWYDAKQSYDASTQSYVWGFYQPTSAVKQTTMAAWCEGNCFRSGAAHTACTLDTIPGENTPFYVHCFCTGNGACDVNPCPAGFTCALDMDTLFSCNL